MGIPEEPSPLARAAIRDRIAALDAAGLLLTPERRRQIEDEART
jgi:hypothetical protein